MNEDSLGKRYIAKLLSNSIGVIIGIIMVSIVPNALGPKFYGYFSYLQQFFNQVLSFFDAGTSTAFFIKISARNNRKELLKFYLIFVFLLISMLFLLIFFVDYFGFRAQLFNDIHPRYIYLGLAFSFFTWLVQLFIKISDAYAITSLIEIVKVAHKILSLCVLIYLINSADFDLIKYYYFNIFSIIVFLGISTYFFIKKDIFVQKIFTLKIQFIKIFKEFLHFCTPIVTYSVVGIGVSIFDIWSLQRIGGSEEVGFYNLSLSIVGITFLITGAISSVISREFSKNYEEGKVDEIKKIFNRYVPMLYGVTVYFAVFISFQSEVLISIFTDERFKAAAPVLAILAFYSIHQVFGQICGGLFYAYHEVKLLRNINLVGSVIGIVATIIFIYILDVDASVGFALKMLVWQFLHTNVLLYFSTRLLDISFYRLFFHQFYVVVFFIFLAYFSSLIIFLENVVINFLVTGAVYTLIVLLFVYMFPIVFATTREEIRDMFFNLIGKY